MSPLVKGVLLATASGLAALYFAVIAWRASSVAGVLLRSGYEAKGWTERRLALRVRIVGVAGGVMALLALGVALARAL